MASGRASSVLEFLRGLVSVRRAAQTSDGQLLERFTRQHDETAFTELVQRHGPMVLGVCRRVLHDPNDADDAFQATFLVLVRKAGSLLEPESLGNWLYGVACRTALKARTEAARRRARQRQMVEVPAPDASSDLLWRDLRPVLDEEVSRLPARYRAPFVLCYLEGKTNEEAAVCLGCPLGTVLSRLARARAWLRTRLARRGVILSAGSLAAVLAEKTAAAVLPVTLAETAVKLGLLFGSGKTATGMLSPQVIALAEGVLQAMFVSKIKVAAAVLLAVALCAGAGVLGYRALAAEPPPEKKTEPPPAGADARKADEARKEAEAADKMRRLLKARVDAARQEWEDRMKLLQDGRDGDRLDVLGAASRRLLVAQRELSENKADQIAAWEAHLDRMKGVEEIAKGRFEAGTLSRPNHALAQYYRLDAEIGLERAKAK
jgi:RNA polymerase sigma factor (sigma-70 family)